MWKETQGIGGFVLVSRIGGSAEESLVRVGDPVPILLQSLFGQTLRGIRDMLVLSLETTIIDD